MIVLKQCPRGSHLTGGHLAKEDEDMDERSTFSEIKVQIKKY